LNPVSAGIVVGSCTFLAGAAIEIVSFQYLVRTKLVVLADDFIIGIAAGVLVFIYEQRRNRYLLERLRVIAEMNHHVRNALQVVLYSAEKQKDEEVEKMLRESMDRIEWALREVLEGKNTA
jgi:hypothetical protein